MKNENQFYPTPKEVVNKLLLLSETFKKEGFKYDKTFLEPSAGKGNLLDCAFELQKALHYNYSVCDRDIKCIELNKEFQTILKEKGYNVIWDDFLKFNTFEKFDYILMNPPFKEGAKHLLKAIELINKNGGEIFCILNSNTLLNNYSNERKTLLSLLEELNAKIEYVDNGFSQAEVKTDVKIALINIKFENNEDSMIFKSLEKNLYLIEEQFEGNNNSLIPNDVILGLVANYNAEVRFGLKLIDEFNNFKKVSLFDYKGKYGKGFELSYNDKKIEQNSNRTNFIKSIRRKYWSNLFYNEKITKLLTSQKREELYNELNNFANFEFNVKNIFQLQLNLMESLNQTILDTIDLLFEEMTTMHSYNEDYSKNIHYFNGWKTNKAYKIAKKVILPIDSYNNYRNEFDVSNYRVVDKITDITKSIGYLKGLKINQDMIKSDLDKAKIFGEIKNIDVPFLKLTFYKKGTCHITFKSEEDLRLLNRYGARKRNFLPPSYGYKKYEDMTIEEQAIVNEFEGKESYIIDFNNNKMLNSMNLNLLTD